MRNQCWIWRGGSAGVAPFRLKYRVKGTGAGRSAGQDWSGCPEPIAGCRCRVTAEEPGETEGLDLREP